MKSADFPHLHSLMLGGLHSDRILTEFVEVWGHQLTTLRLETILTVIPLHTIGENCSNLIEFQIINARLSINQDHNCIEQKNFFSKLKLIYFFLINYVVNTDLPENSKTDKVVNPITALHCILRHAQKLEGIQATGNSSFTDDSLSSITKVNTLKNLRRFILTDAAVQHHPGADPHPAVTGIAPPDNNGRRNQHFNGTANGNPLQGDETNTSAPRLTAQSVIKLFEMCPYLQCAGDLRHWAISIQERRQIFKLIQNRHSAKCIVNSCGISNTDEQSASSQSRHLPVQ